MVDWLIAVSLRNRVLVVAFFLLIGGWGYWALLTTPIDAIPDLSDNQVIVFTDWTGRSPQEVEDQITYPLTVSLQGLPGVRVVRSSSAFGFSMISVIFEDNVALYSARSRVLERLQLLSKSLPPGTVPTLGPDATGVGHVFWYTVEGKGHTLRDLRSIQDWFIRYQLNAVPGVAEVASIGGVVRQYQIDVDPHRLRAYQIPLSTVVDAVMRSNRNVGANVVEASGTWSVVRGLGLIENTRDLEDIVVAADNGVPIFVRQVATVKIGDAFRAAALVKGVDEAVGGVIVARYGVSTVDVIKRVKEKIRALQAGLPPGVTIVPFYDRSALIERAVHTLRRALIEETIVVTLINILFLLPFRSVLSVTLPLPLAVLTAFLFMRYLGISSNIMSLAGIAIAIGVLVDAAIVVTENAFRFMERRGVNPRNRLRVTETVLDATRLVGRPIFFSMAIIILAFIPVFALTGQEGKLFHPLAFTKTFSMVGATLLSVTLVPVLCSLLIGGRIRSEERNPIMRPLVWLYRPLLDFALHHRVITVGIAVVTAAGGPGARPADRQRVYAAAERRRSNVHAGDGSLDLAAAGDRDCEEAERRDPEVSRSRDRCREDRARGYLDRSRTREHDRSHRQPQARVSMATRDDAREADRRDGRCRHAARRVEYLDAADHQPHQHADDRHPLGGRRKGLRHGPQGVAGTG